MTKQMARLTSAQTALEMDRRGLAFAAVHDSFWTHPADIDGKA